MWVALGHTVLTDSDSGYPLERLLAFLVLHVRPCAVAHLDSGWRPDFFDPRQLRAESSNLSIQRIELLFIACFEVCG